MRRLGLAPRGAVSSARGGWMLMLHSLDGVPLQRDWSCVSPVAMGRVAVLSQKFELYGAKPGNAYKSTTVFKSRFILKLCQPLLVVTNRPYLLWAAPAFSFCPHPCHPCPWCQLRPLSYRELIQGVKTAEIHLLLAFGFPESLFCQFGALNQFTACPAETSTSMGH